MVTHFGGVLRYISFVHATKEADDAHEFIRNLPSDMKLKLVVEAPNYPVYGNNLLLLVGRCCSNHLLQYRILINEVFVAVHRR